MEQDAPMPAGRPRSEFPRRSTVRHNDEQMAAWQAAAKVEGRELQNWIRRTLDSAARKAARKP
jgi:predicted HicB family RNase H-like nuclease